MGSNDVFISYRRDAAGWLALCLCQQLTASGIDVFYDIWSIRTGHFDTFILNQIKARPYFIVVLTPGTLNRCVNSSDWLRREIEHALETGRRVVPVYTTLFDFDDLEKFLPLNIGRELRRWQAVEIPYKHFKHATEELVEEYLMPVDIEVTPTPPGDLAEVQLVQQQTATERTVTESQLNSQEHFERAYKLMWANDHEEAIIEVNRAIALDPNNASAFVVRGDVHEFRRNLDESIADYDRAIALDPNNANAFLHRGLARDNRGERDEAIADYDRAIALDPSDAGAFYNRGLIRTNVGNLDGAIADFDRVIELDPTTYIGCFYHRGVAHQDRGELDKAIADFERGKQLEQNYKEMYDRKLQELGALVKPDRGG